MGLDSVFPLAAVGVKPLATNVVLASRQVVASLRPQGAVKSQVLLGASGRVEKDITHENSLGQAEVKESTQTHFSSKSGSICQKITSLQIEALLKNL